MNGNSGIQHQRIPDITEWFQSLSTDDRVLCLTMIDDFFTKSVISMKTKIKRLGEGVFKYQEKVVKATVTKNVIP
jgi:hypothetical protein